MIRGLAILLAISAAPALAQGVAPDPAALDLARLLMTRDETLYDDSDTTRIQARIENQLLASDGACNPFQSECRGAATDVARQFVPAYRQSERTRREQVTAYLISDNLRPDEMARLSTYLRSDEGTRLLTTLAMLRDPDRSERRRREIERNLDRTAPDAMAAARAQFRQRTRNLPRNIPH